jgi:hypothetical protein
MVEGRPISAYRSSSCQHVLSPGLVTAVCRLQSNISTAQLFPQSTLRRPAGRRKYRFGPFYDIQTVRTCPLKLVDKVCDRMLNDRQSAMRQSYCELRS